MIRLLIAKRSAIMSFLLFMLPALAAAETEVGHVVWVKGTFNAGSRILQRLSPIYLHDVLSTGANSMAEIAFTDNTLMTFKADSRYSVDNYKFAPAASGNFAGTLFRGGFRTITGLIAKKNPRNYEINTPVATLGVRGTDYQATLSGGYLYVAVYSGTVCINMPGNTVTSEPTSPCPCGLYQLMSGKNAAVPNYNYRGEG